MGLLTCCRSRKVEHESTVVPKFYRSVTKQVKRVIYSPDGVEVSSDVMSVPYREELSADELEHFGVSCDMFTIENMQDAGVEMSVVTKPLFALSLDARSRAADAINNLDLDSLTEKDFETKPE